MSAGRKADSDSRASGFESACQRHELIRRIKRVWCLSTGRTMDEATREELAGRLQIDWRKGKYTYTPEGAPQ
jgi:hypothetical protein